jgi:N utilization substance protein A
MIRELNQDTIQAINAFEELTGARVRDCIIDASIYFLVNPGTAGRAIGKAGASVRNAEKRIGRPIKIYEWAESTEAFIKNLIPQASRITVAGEQVTVTVPQKSRGAVFGRGGSNLKLLKELLIRNSNIRELAVK